MGVLATEKVGTVLYRNEQALDLALRALGGPQPQYLSLLVDALTQDQRPRAVAGKFKLFIQGTALWDFFFNF